MAKDKETTKKPKQQASKKGAPKKRTKVDLVADMRKYKQEIQQVRFGLSKESLQKRDSRGTLRKMVARTATQITVLTSGDVPDDASV